MSHRLGRRGMLAAVAVATVVLGAGGCGADGAPGPSGDARPEVVPAPGDHVLTIDSGGAERTWELHAPPSYRPGTPVPLVVALHGTGQSLETLREISGLDAVADQEGFLVAYPKALGREFSRLADQGDDVTFVRALVDQLVTTWSVDPARVYATGFSSGARLTYALGVEAADVFAAIGPVSGAFAGAAAETDPGYKPSRPVSMITFVGSQDRDVSRIYAGLARWQRNLGCQVGEPVWIDKDKTVNRTVSRCADGSEAIDYTVKGMGHTWPSATGYQAAIDASVVMWEFFAAHPRRS